MLTEQPQLARARDPRLRRLARRDVVEFVGLGLQSAQEAGDVILAEPHTSERVLGLERFQHRGEGTLVPSGELRRPIERNRERCCGHIVDVEFNDIALGPTELAHRDAALVSLPRLGWLAADAKDDWMPYIAAMPRLRFLGAQDTSAGDDGFVALGRSASLQYLWGRRCHNLRRRGFLALSRMPALRALSVSCLNVDDEGIAALPDFPALRELMPMDVPDAGYRHIGRCAALESLVLMYCRDTTDAATEHLAGLPRLRSYFNSYTSITDRTPRCWRRSHRSSV